MTDDNTFVVDLGAGVYLDAQGQITYTAPHSAQIYKPPDGLKIDPKKVEDIFKDLAGILPADAEAQAKWVKWGVPANIAKFLGSIAGVVGVVATVISVYAWIIGVALYIAGEVIGDDGLSPALGQALQGLKNTLNGQEQLARVAAMIEMHAQFDGRLDEIAGILAEFNLEEPISTDELVDKYARMQAVLAELAVPLSQVRTQDWAVVSDPDAYAGRAFVSQILVLENGDGTTAAVPSVPPGVTVFDYRIGVPMLLYASTTYASMAQVAMPWFRSSGIYAQGLRKTADAIDTFVLRMQRECLARTASTPATLGQQLLLPIPEIPINGEDGVEAIFGSGGLPSKLTGRPYYAVGAFDLVAYDDTFLGAEYFARALAGEPLGRRGTFDYRWQTLLGKYGTFQQAVTESPDDTAAQANDQETNDYARLQLLTGMATLVRQSAWLRFLSTPPIVSQTIAGKASSYRAETSHEQTVATSPAFPHVGVIEHPATKKHYTAYARADARTHLPGLRPNFRYRVVLRTLASAAPNEAWQDLQYVGDVWKARYEPTAADKRVNRIRTELLQNWILDEAVLYEGPSPDHEVKEQGRSVILTAATFDWYVPVKTDPATSFTLSSRLLPHTAALKAAPTEQGSDQAVVDRTRLSGGLSVHLNDAFDDQPLPVRDELVSRMPLSPAIDDVMHDRASALVSVGTAELARAERRHVKNERVHVDWTLHWSNGELVVIVAGRPDERPFHAEVVVEETVYSGEALPRDTPDLSQPLDGAQNREVIHTAYGIEVVNQAMFVPQVFFDKEHQALVDSIGKWHDFVQRYVAVRGPIHPGDPINEVKRTERELLTQSLSTSALAKLAVVRQDFADHHELAVETDAAP